MAEYEAGEGGRSQMTKAWKARIQQWETTAEFPKKKKWPDSLCCSVENRLEGGTQEIKESS